MTGSISELRNKVITHSRRGELDKAKVCCTEILEKDENNIFAHANLANMLFLQGKPSEALAEFNKARQLEPDDVVIRSNLALFYISQGRFGEAQKEIEDLFKINPDYPPAYNVLGNIYFYKHVFPLAKRNYQKAVKLDPKLGDAWNNLGNVFTEEKNWCEAECCYKNALRLNPGNPSWSGNLGKVLLAQNKPELALDYYRRALKINPEISNVRKVLVNVCTVLGAKYYKEGNFKKAAGFFEEAVAANPKDIKLYNRLAGVELVLQNYPEAYKWYSLCKKNCPGADLTKYPYLKRLSRSKESGD